MCCLICAACLALEIAYKDWPITPPDTKRRQLWEESVKEEFLETRDLEAESVNSTTPGILGSPVLVAPVIDHCRVHFKYYSIT